jgi:hypothetical protein
MKEKEKEQARMGYIRKEEGRMAGKGWPTFNNGSESR